MNDKDRMKIKVEAFISLINSEDIRLGSIAKVIEDTYRVDREFAEILATALFYSGITYRSLLDEKVIEKFAPELAHTENRLQFLQSKGSREHAWELVEDEYLIQYFVPQLKKSFRHYVAKYETKQSANSRLKKMKSAVALTR